MKTVTKLSFEEYINSSEKIRQKLEDRLRYLYLNDVFCQNSETDTPVELYLCNEMQLLNLLEIYDSEYSSRQYLKTAITTWGMLYYDDRMSVIETFNMLFIKDSQETIRFWNSLLFCRIFVHEFVGILNEGHDCFIDFDM